MHFPTRVPHHFVRSSSGHCSFRQRVTVELRSVLGWKVIKHALHMKELIGVRLGVLILASGYAQCFDVLRDRRVDRISKKDMDVLVKRLSQGVSLRDLPFHRTQTSDGTISERWQTDSDEDLRLFRKDQTWANAAEGAGVGAGACERSLRSILWVMLGYRGGTCLA